VSNAKAGAERKEAITNKLDKKIPWGMAGKKPPVEK